MIGGSQTPELEIQHEMNHFSSFPIGSSTPRVPREYLTRLENGGQSHQSVSSTTASSLPHPSYRPTVTNILENLGISGKKLFKK